MTAGASMLEASVARAISRLAASADEPLNVPASSSSSARMAAGASAPEEEEEERREQQRRGGGQLQHGGRRLGEQRLRVRERAAHE